MSVRYDDSELAPKGVDVLKIRPTSRMDVALWVKEDGTMGLGVRFQDLDRYAETFKMELPPHFLRQALDGARVLKKMAEFDQRIDDE